MTGIPGVRLTSVGADALGLLEGRRGAAVLGALGFCATVVLVQRFDAPLVLLAGVAALLGVLLLARPEIATLITVFALYLNVPAILTKRHGVPMAAAGAVILLLGVPVLQALVIRRERFRLDATLCLMLAFLAVVLASSVVARDAGVTVAFAQRFVLEGVLVYLLVVNAVRDWATLRRVVWTVLAAGALLGALTTYQEVTGSYRQEFGGLAERNYEFGELRLLDPEDPEVRELMQAYTEANGPVARVSQRANGPLDEPNRFGQIMVVLLPLSLLAFRAGQSARARLGAAAAGALVVCGIVVSDSRGAFVTILLLALLAGGIRWISRERLMAVALAGIFVIPLVAPKYVERIASLAGAATLAEDRTSAAADGAIKGRAAAMIAAGRVFMDHPIVGVGAGQFQPFYSAEYQRNDPRFRFRSIRNYHAHSLYLQIAAELGVVGLVAFLGIFAFQLRELVRARRRWMTARPELAELATAFAFSILAYLGASVFLHLGFQRYLWLVVALSSAALHVIRAAEREGPLAEAAR